VFGRRTGISPSSPPAHNRAAAAAFRFQRRCAQEVRAMSPGTFPAVLAAPRAAAAARRLAGLTFACIASLAQTARAQDVDLGYAPIVDAVVHVVAAQPDGKALIGGGFTQVNGQSCGRLCRLLADGSVDPAFADPDANGAVYAIAVAADGKLLAGGDFTAIGAQARAHLARLNEDGSLDTTFADPAVNGTVVALAAQPDGKVLLSGSFGTVGGQARSSVVRLNADGSLDATFVDPGVPYVDTLALQPDGKVVIGGRFTMVGGQTRNHVARLNADGSLDASFADSAANDQVRTLALQADAKVLIGGDFGIFGGGQARSYLARLTANGSLDATFADARINNLPVSALAVQPNGKVWVGGYFSMIGGHARRGVARLNADGSFDATLAGPGTDNDVYALALQADGKVLVAGLFTTLDGQARKFLARLNAEADQIFRNGFD
jgi:uncharacterized delta-60 repeat protein